MTGDAVVDEVVELDLGVVPEAAVSGALLLQTEYSCVLTFNAMRPTPGGEYEFEDAGTTVVEFPGCLVSQFGYPNDEALDGHPLAARVELSYGIYEVRNPSWVRRLEAQNRVAFPSTGTWDSRHFLLVFHDSTFECLADDIRLTIESGPYKETFARIAARALAE